MVNIGNSAQRMQAKLSAACAPAISRLLPKSKLKHWAAKRVWWSVVACFRLRSHFISASKNSCSAPLRARWSKIWL